MQKPFQEICNKFYNSNSRSHISDIAKDVKKQPIGLNNDPAGTILKKYYEVMIDSKNEKVLDFLLNQLKIKGEINDLINHERILLLYLFYLLLYFFLSFINFI